MDSTLALFFAIFCGELLLHASLLALSYFWDEAGYYIPAARDLLLHGSLIPSSTITNPHPPVLMIWLASWWKVFGFHPVVTRIAMLLVASFSLLGIFRLGSHVANKQVAAATVVCTALYPVFFAQSSLAHLDMAATAFTVWGLLAYLRNRMVSMLAFFSLAALSKETAILAPLALIFWEALGFISQWKTGDHKFWIASPCLRRMVWLALTVIPLFAWLGWQYRHTGFLFGNREFYQYNLASTLSPLRFVAALMIRAWQLLGYMNMFVLVVATWLAMTRPPLKLESNNGEPPQDRGRISLPVQLIFAVVIFAYVVALSVFGGAVLARYLLPVYPLIILMGVSTVWRRIPWWPAFLGIICGAFVLALVTDPPYRAAPEDNLGYANFVRVHQEAARLIESQYPIGPVLTAWPASDELSKPYLGYVSRPIPVIRIEDFSAQQILALRDTAVPYRTSFVFSSKYEPLGGYIIRLSAWDRILARYFDYHRDLPPDAIAEMLNGKVAWSRRLGNEWGAVIDFDFPVNASIRKSSAFSNR